jgi:putative ATP-dependent endonuclease of OLD family
LTDLTVLLGANNAGKTSFLDAVYAAIGSGRRPLGQEDVHIAPGEAVVPKEREVVIDIQVRPIGEDGKPLANFPVGSFWVELWGSNIMLDGNDFTESVGIRTRLAWSAAKGDYAVERKFLKEWLDFAAWLTTPVSDKAVTATQVEPIALHYIDAKRDLEEDLHRPGSFWRRLTDDLGLPPADIAAIEAALTDINKEIVDKSEVLQHLRDSLRSIQGVVSADSEGINVSPVARRFQDLSRGVDVSFSTAGAQPFPLARHGMGTRSLASLLVFRAFTAWKAKTAGDNDDKLHSILALEEPESHLHPQAQRSLFGQIKGIPGQRIVSTHSPYFAAQAGLEDLRLFIKESGVSYVSRLPIDELQNKDDIRKLKETVIETRGDLLFSSGLVVFEGQTEEQALPVWAEAYWGASIHELGFSFVRANGTQYFPLIWLAKKFHIPWYVFADGEPQPVQRLNEALKKAGEGDHNACENVVVIEGGRNFESMLLNDGYLPEVERALDGYFGKAGALDEFIKQNHGKSYGPDKGDRDYDGEDGRLRAALDSMKSMKTKLAKPLAHTISTHPDPKRRFPPAVKKLFEKMSEKHSLTRCEASKK